MQLIGKIYGAIDHVNDHDDSMITKHSPETLMFVKTRSFAIVCAFDVGFCVLMDGDKSMVSGESDVPNILVGATWGVVDDVSLPGHDGWMINDLQP
eukprot:4534822-Amphidinium_carterae.2